MWKSTAPRCQPRLLLCILFFVLIHPSFELDCTWSGITNEYISGSTQYFISSSMDVCKAQCESRQPDCKATYLKGGLCVFLSDPTLPRVSDLSSTFSEITSCGGPCEMETVSGFTSASAATYSINLQEDAESSCIKLCENIDQCQALSYSTTTCRLYDPEPASTSATSGFTYVKMDGWGCAIRTGKSNSQGSANPVLTVARSVDGCKEVCMKIRGCNAFSEQDGLCNFYENVNVGAADNLKTYFKKSDSCDGTEVTLSLGTKCCSGTKNQPLKILVASETTTESPTTTEAPTTTESPTTTEGATTGSQTTENSATSVSPTTDSADTTASPASTTGVDNSTSQNGSSLQAPGLGTGVNQAVLGGAVLAVFAVCSYSAVVFSIICIRRQRRRAKLADAAPVDKPGIISFANDVSPHDKSYDAHKNDGI